MITPVGPSIKSNLNASGAPAACDDSADGYAVGSTWIDTTNDNAYICLDASAGAAVWANTTAEGIVYYGVAWDENADTYTRTGYLAGVACGASPDNSVLPIQAAMRRCVINDSGVVQYYLDASDSTKKADGTASDLTRGDGQVMVEIPAFWYKHGYAGTTHTWEICNVPLPGFSLHPAFFKNDANVNFRYIGAYEGSMWDKTTGAMVPPVNIIDNMYAAGDKLCSYSGEFPKTNETRAGFRGMAAERGTGWRQIDYDLMSAVQLLYLTEYADFYSQSTIGMGRTQLSGGSWAANSYIGQCGKSNGDGNGTNSVAGNANNAYMTYRGIENFFGNVWSLVDGININNNIPYVSNNDSDFADDTSTNYTDLSIVLANATGWQSTLEQVSRGFLPASVGAGAGSTTKITDHYMQDNGWRTVALGGHATYGVNAGAFYFNALDDAPTIYTSVGSRLAY